ncbi:MAG: hypothetical protein KatS3mg109_1711 [Pirellulaceae bacterium]|nr:MAG: hypothetical protein KatS3mg109_1711 [Pirellulaceae bacterium]
MSTETLGREIENILTCGTPVYIIERNVQLKHEISALRASKRCV